MRRRPARQVIALVRPEALVVTADDAGDCVVVVATFRGSTTRLRLLRTDGFELLADVASHRADELTPGRRVSVVVARSSGAARHAVTPGRTFAR